MSKSEMIENTHATNIGAIFTYRTMQGDALNLDEMGWGDPYSLEYSYLVYMAEVAGTLGEQATWSEMPDYIEGPLVEDGLTEEQVSFLVDIGVAANAGVSDENFEEKMSKTRAAYWAEAAMELAKSVRSVDGAEVAISMHRAETALDEAGNFTYTNRVNPKRLHKKDNPSEIAAAIEQSDDEIGAKDRDIDINDPFLATGASLVGLVCMLVDLDQKPKSITINCLFATQQGMDTIKEIADHFEIDLRIRPAAILHNLNDHGYVLYTENDSVGLQIQERLRNDFEQETAVSELQAGGDAGDMLVAYCKENDLWKWK